MSIPGRATLALLAVLYPALAGARSPAQRCQDAIVGAGERIFARSLATLGACQRRVARGAVVVGTDCTFDPAVSGRRATAAARVARRVRTACAGDATVRPAGACSGVHTPEALAACIQASHDDGAAALGRVAAAGGPLLVPGRRCQTAASGAVSTFALARLRVLQRCKRHPPADLAPGTTCGSDAATAARIARFRAAATRRIAAGCRRDALSGVRFGDPCAAPANAEALAACLLAAADGASDTALAAEFPDRGFCGDAFAAVETRITGLLARMTLDEKIEQMHGAGYTGRSHTAANTKLGIPGIVMVDGPRGVGATVGTATSFPVGMARGATWDPALEEHVGDAVGTEVRAKGVGMLLAPTMNILRHPRWGRAQETYGEDTVHLGRMATAFIRGVQRHVIASAKHFAGNSIENTRFNVDVLIDERTLREIYLPHFRMAVQDGHTGSVMSAYNKVNGHYCGENLHLLHDVLKGDWGFQGFVESDWIAGTRSTVPSMQAGLDIEMPAPQYYGQPLADAVNAGEVPATAVDAAVRRILRAQFCFHLDTDSPVEDPTQVETPAHTDLALQVARESIVLLKNDRAALPLDRARVSSIVIVGATVPVPAPAPGELKCASLAETPNLGDRGSSFVAPSTVVVPLSGIGARAGRVTVTHVVPPSTAAKPPPGDPTPQCEVLPLLAADATTIAAADAAVVVVGLYHVDEGEGLITHGDRDGLVLPRNQDALVAAVAALNARTIVVLEGSGPVTMPWLNDVGAVLMAWYPGEEGGNAIADLVFGDVNPSGRLPVSFPRAEADLPAFDNTSAAVMYDYFHGYRWLDKYEKTPLFPFGFGLSYTTFRYANLAVRPAAVSPFGRALVTAEVTNTGQVAGDEVAQLYVGYEGSRVARAVNDLKAFERVHLEPGETKTVAFDLRAADLAFWDTAAGDWDVEGITYDVRVGPSSRDLPLEGRFAVAR